MMSDRLLDLVLIMLVTRDLNCANYIARATLPKIDRKEFESTISQLGAKLKAADVVQKTLLLVIYF